MLRLRQFKLILILLVSLYCYFFTGCAFVQAVETEFTFISADHSYALQLQHGKQKFTLDFALPGLIETRIAKFWKFNQKSIPVPAFADNTLSLEEKKILVIDNANLEKFLETELSPQVSLPKQDVLIKKSETPNEVSFEGTFRDGEVIDYDSLLFLIKYALENKASYIQIPFKKALATLTTEGLDFEIKEILSVGESDFSGSPPNRVYNLKRGIEILNGAILTAGKEFSFNQMLGPVNLKTGFKKELVIQGENTEPDYGGGLCQVSTTLYRAALKAGLPITVRKPHSYAVSYYYPYGLDATISQPQPDLRFVNDTAGPLVIQGYTEKNKVYFKLYGLADGRTTELKGPFVSNWVEPPPDQIIETTELPLGQTEIKEKPHRGFKARWIRQIFSSNGKTITEEILSSYEARPKKILIGVETGEETKSDGVIKW
ncbi:hypothetical protein COT40_01875 [Candidatus Peregrinibacteria bacterium CG08_land_8_20_14_0_20_41_10]|nr:MAG: hypothetical protein COT40_01875 [Candidatus Peregrinibacteria bacterium CG08_land_8_20_14_0_20_41_10]